MFEELMRECRNWFVTSNGVHLGEFSIKGGSIVLPFLRAGQYFRIVGSVLNDGVYQSWAAVYAALVLAGFELHDMPSANYVWGSYLRRCGWKRYTLPNSCPDCYTVAQFAKDHSDGTYILAMATHVVCVQNGDWLDTWDSGDEVPLYYWQKG